MTTPVSPGFDGAHVDLSSAPGADTPWDDFFPPEGPSTPQTSPAVQPSSAPQATSNEPFLKAGETVYLTPDAAVQGTIHKDNEIARLRTYLKDNGIDPNELKRVQAQSTSQSSSQAQPSQTPGGPKYFQQGQRYFDALSDAVTKGDRTRYEEITAEYQREALNATLAPYGPLLSEVARQRAVRQVSAEIPDFQRFVETPEFRKTAESIPLLKEMIAIGESDPNAAQRLPEVYKTVYLMFQGMSRPQTSSQAPIQAPPVNNTPTVRPVQTMSNSTLTPPPPGRDTRTWATDRDARKQLVEDGKARGIDAAVWESLGL